MNLRTKSMSSLAATGLTLAGSMSVCAQVADLRVVHASPDAPAVDVLVNDQVVFAGAPFTGVTAYAQLFANTYNIKVNAAGTSQTVINVDLPVEKDVDYTVVAVNELANIEPQVLIDDNTIDVDNARVRFFHASPNAPAVDVAVAGGPTLFGDIEYREVGDYITVTPGEYDLEVLVSGTSQVVLNLDDVQLNAGTVYTVYAMGLVGGDPMLQAVFSVDNEIGDPQIADIFPGLAGEKNGLRIRGAVPGDDYALAYGSMMGSTSVSICPGLTVDIQNARLAGLTSADALGEAVFVRPVHQAVAGKTLYLQGINLTNCSTTDITEVIFK